MLKNVLMTKLIKAKFSWKYGEIGPKKFYCMNYYFRFEFDPYGNYNVLPLKELQVNLLSLII